MSIGVNEIVKTKPNIGTILKLKTTSEKICEPLKFHKRYQSRKSVLKMATGISQNSMAKTDQNYQPDQPLF